MYAINDIMCVERTEEKFSTRKINIISGFSADMNILLQPKIFYAMEKNHTNFYSGNVLAFIFNHFQWHRPTTGTYLFENIVITG